MKIIKAVINNDWGCFCLTNSEMEEYCKLKGIEVPEDEIDKFHIKYDVYRGDPALIEMVEQRNKFEVPTSLSIVKIIDDHPDFGWEIIDYDGYESISYFPYNILEEVVVN